jgi:hypothetical protein
MRFFETGVVGVIVGAMAVACGDDAGVGPGGTTGPGAGGTASSGGASGGGGEGDGGGSAAGGAGGGTTNAGGGGATGGGGEGGAPATWPTCDTQPANAPTKSIQDVWNDDPMAPEPVWVPGVYVTAVSGSGCTGGTPCQIFVQQQETFASIAEGSQQAIKLFASAATASHFEGIAVGDRIDVYAHAWRYDINGQNELLLQVATALPGCAKVVGIGNPQPVAGLSLVDLTVDLYEETMGPLLIQVDAVSGSPDGPNELFGLWPAFMPGTQPLEEITSLSPHALPNGAFVGLTQGLIHNFSHVVGVYSLFLPASAPAKYEVLYIRSMADAPFGGQ